MSLIARFSRLGFEFSWTVCALWNRLLTTFASSGERLCNGRPTLSVRPSVCLSRRSTAAAAYSWFSAVQARAAYIDLYLPPARAAIASLPALVPWAPPSRTGPLARKYLPGFPYSWSGNKIISLKKFYFTTASWGPPKRKKPGALGTCPVCPLVKTALTRGGKHQAIRSEGRPRTCQLDAASQH